MDIATMQSIPQMGLHSMICAGTGWANLGWHNLGWHGLSFSTLIHFKLGFLQIHSADWTLLAQQFDTDPFRGVRAWFANLVATGQLWALIIGFIVGYIFRGFTSYG